MKRRIIFEQDDNYSNYNSYNNEEYIPERGEAFFQGFSSSLLEAGKVVIVLSIIVIIYLLFGC